MISVIIAAKNASKYIRETIESIRKQNIKDIEIIVVCDSCTDNTKQIAQEFCCKVVEVNFSRISKTRNAGLNFASGEYILYIDADDILNENSIFALYNEFIKDTSIEAVFGMTQDFISPELSDTDKAKLKARTDNYFGILPGASLIKRNVFEK